MKGSDIWGYHVRSCDEIPADLPTVELVNDETITFFVVQMGTFKDDIPNPTGSPSPQSHWHLEVHWVPLKLKTKEERPCPSCYRHPTEGPTGSLLRLHVTSDLVQVPSEASTESHTRDNPSQLWDRGKISREDQFGWTVNKCLWILDQNEKGQFLTLSYCPTHRCFTLEEKAVF